MKKEKKKDDSNVVRFTAQTEETHEEETHQPSYEEIVEILSEMDDVEYDRCRHAKAFEGASRSIHWAGCGSRRCGCGNTKRPSSQRPKIRAN